MTGDRQFALAQAAAYAIAANVAAEFPPDPLHHAGFITELGVIFYRWLTAAVTITPAIAAVTSEQHGGTTTPTHYQGDHMATLTDTQQVELSVAETDSAGQPVTSDALVWASDSASIVVTPSADGYSALAVAGVPGLANVTVTDTSVTPPLVGALALTVIPGAATSLTIEEGAPVDKPPAV